MIESDVINVEDTNEQKVVTVDTGFDEQESVNVDRSEVNVHELIREQKQANEFFGILNKKPEYEKHPMHINLFYTYLRKLIRYKDIQPYAPIFNEYYQNLYGAITEPPSDSLIKQQKIGYNIHTKRLISTEYGGISEVDTKINILGTDDAVTMSDMMLHPYESAIRAPIALSKAHIYKIFNNYYINNPKVFNTINRFAHRIRIPSISTKLYYATNKMIYSELISYLDELKRREIYCPNVMIPFTKNDMKLEFVCNYPKFPDSSVHTLSRCHITEKLPMKIINELTRGTPNVHFIQNSCSYDEKTGTYLLKLDNFLTADEYNVLSENEKIFPVLCRHEYLQYVDPDYEALAKECFIKGKCRYCNTEIFSDTVDNKFEVSSTCYFAIQYYAKLASKFFVNAQDIVNGINGLASALFLNATLSKEFIMYDNSRVYSFIIGSILSYVHSHDDFPINPKNVTKLDNLIKDVFDHANIDMKPKVITEEPKNKELLTAFIMVHCKPGDVKREDLYSLKNLVHDEISKKLCELGPEEMHKYHTMMFYLNRKLWSRGTYRQLHNNIEKKNVDAMFKVEDNVKLSDAEVNKLISIARGICPVNAFHEYGSKGCKHCGYVKGLSFKKTPKEAREYAEKWTNSFKTLSMVEVLTEDLLLNPHIDFASVKELLAATKNSTITSFVDHLMASDCLEIYEGSPELVKQEYGKAIYEKIVIKQLKNIIHSNAVLIPISDIDALTDDQVISIILYLVSIGRVGFSSIVRLVQKRVKNSMLKFIITTVI